ncbi:SipW-dependent-type signal peptide-containing protein [Leucobacter chromiiresistens]|uniref:SipW-dependent-type signal peptide-containing protein n=1 Tax=Leucobacter chromiiresistens TaxID=1079994 RepID=UPI000AF5399C|nr:SipW-dependent-type signal peptide-containing protein [Leucobacter chromiiresistens]
MELGGRPRSVRRHGTGSGGWFAKTRALLAGALVLGVGGSLTLAAWTDTETARATFTASTFGIVGSANNGATYTDNTAAAPAALSFSVTPTAMSPGTVTYAKFLVRTTDATNVTGTAALSAATTTTSSATSLAGFLTYGVRVIPSAQACDATSFAASTSIVVPNGSALTVAGSSTTALAAGGASPVAYCFAVTLPAGTSNAAQGTNTTATWTVTGASTS